MRIGGSRRSATWTAAGAGAFATLALALSACGGGSPDATASGGSPPRAESAATGPKAPARPAPTPDTCNGQVGEFLHSMAALRTDLVAGLSYQEYLAEVQSIKTTYRRVPVGELALGCLRAAGTPGESGLNEYIAASNAWTECVETPDCESATVEPALQSRWRKASKLLSEAQKGLASLEKHPNSS